MKVLDEMKVKNAVIGGSKAYTLLNENKIIGERIGNVQTPFGKSQVIFLVKWDDIEFLFLTRHGEKDYDGSNDDSFEILSEMAKVDKRVKIVQFRKNFGQTAAISAGIEYSQGDILILMDADLQMPGRYTPTS